MQPMVMLPGGQGHAGGQGQGEAVEPGGGSSLTAGVATLFAAVALVVAVTVVQGLWTDRWGGRDVNKTLEQDAKLLESLFPERFGDWEFEKELESDPAQLKRAGAVGHVSRLYRNVRTKGRVSAFVVCATPHDASGHTPDRCYPGAGFEIGESEHRQTVTLDDGRKAETFTGTFRKQGQTLRVFWTYGGDGQWVAPQIARIELAGRDSVFKLYAIIDETRIKGVQSMQECVDFLGTLLPVLDEALATGRAAEAPGPGDEAGKAAA